MGGEYKPGTPKTDRNRAILEMRKDGATLAEIGRRFEIGKERVRQIYLREERRERFMKFKKRNGTRLLCDHIEIDHPSWQEACNGKACAFCTLKDERNGECKIRNYIQKQPAYEERPHGECKTCKHYVPYREQFLYRHRGDGYCKSAITTSEGEAYINCHDEWYCANYEKEGEAE